VGQYEVGSQRVSAYSQLARKAPASDAIQQAEKGAPRRRVQQPYSSNKTKSICYSLSLQAAEARKLHINGGSIFLVTQRLDLID
jgi:hypothetical protein